MITLNVAAPASPNTLDAKSSSVALDGDGDRAGSDGKPTSFADVLSGFSTEDEIEDLRGSPTVDLDFTELDPADADAAPNPRTDDPQTDPEAIRRAPPARVEEQVTIPVGEALELALESGSGALDAPRRDALKTSGAAVLSPDTAGLAMARTAPQSADAEESLATVTRSTTRPDAARQDQVGTEPLQERPILAKPSADSGERSPDFAKAPTEKSPPPAPLAAADGSTRTAFAGSEKPLANSPAETLLRGQNVQHPETRRVAVREFPADVQPASPREAALAEKGASKAEIVARPLPENGPMRIESKGEARVWPVERQPDRPASTATIAFEQSRGTSARADAVSDAPPTQTMSSTRQSNGTVDVSRSNMQEQHFPHTTINSAPSIARSPVYPSEVANVAARYVAANDLADRPSVPIPTPPDGSKTLTGTESASPDQANASGGGQTLTRAAISTPVVPAPIAGLQKDRNFGSEFLVDQSALLFRDGAAVGARTDAPPPVASSGPVVVNPSLADQPRVALSQIANILIKGTDNRAEILLNPRELGSVRLTMSGLEASLTVTIQADRLETMELMRRHIDILSGELRRAGYDNVSFDFRNGSPHSGGREGTGHGIGREASGAFEGEEPSAGPAGRPTKTTPTGLDLRI